MKITDLPNEELLRLARAVARSDSAEPILVRAVETELARRLEANQGATHRPVPDPDTPSRQEARP